jgi:hypothetical protein
VRGPRSPFASASLSSTPDSVRQFNTTLDTTINYVPRSPEEKDDENPHHARAPQRIPGINRAAHGMRALSEEEEKQERFDELTRAVGQREASRYRWNRFTRNFTVKQERNVRVYRQRRENSRRNMITGSYVIGGGDQNYEEIVFLQEPHGKAYNNRFLNINPVRRFERNFRATDPISAAHSHLWGQLGEFIQISAQKSAIHIRILSKKIPDKAIQILLSRIIEHTQSNQVINPRLLSVQKKNNKKLVSMLMNADQLRTSDIQNLTRIFQRGMARSRHFILKQDSSGGRFHERISQDSLL